MDKMLCNMCGKKELNVRNDILMEDAVIISKSGDTFQEKMAKPTGFVFVKTVMIV